MHYMVVVEVKRLVPLGSRRKKDVGAFLCVCEMSEPLGEGGCGHDEVMCEGA